MKEFHAATGLVYYLFRFYSPLLGRWLRGGPIGERVGSNLYLFLGNQTVYAIAPLGLIQFDGSGVAAPGRGSGVRA
jgi:RHS repeat-associated protein